MTCEQVQELIHAYIDGELDLLRNMEIESHLGECEMCRSEHQDYSNLRTLVQRGAQYFAASKILKKRIEKQVSSQIGNTSCL
jgi:anti-sigma factor RsiW